VPLDGGAAACSPRRATFKEPDTARDLLLHGEDVVQLPVVGLGPETKPIIDLDQLHADAYALSFSSHAAFQHRGHVEFLPDHTQVLVLSFELERRRAAGHVQAGDLAEGIQHLLREAVGEVFLLFVRAHVDEREDRDRPRCGRLCGATP
jgi:hypothetical protein